MRGEETVKRRPRAAMMDAMTHALVIGEALIDIVETADGSRELVGGRPAHVALGRARQGHAARLLTRIGRDPRGERIAEHVTGSGAGLADESWTATGTSTAHARLQPDGSAEYVFDIDWSIDASDPSDAALVHTGSIALFLEPGGTAVLDILRAAAGRALVTLDPNIRPALVGERAAALVRFEQAAAAADLVKLSDEDAAWLYPGLSPEEVLSAVAAHGPRIVVITRGAEGAIGLGPGGIAEVDALAVTVVDTIGAGDAYMASLVASALDEPALFDSDAVFRAALRGAAVAAGLTVARAGANPPTRAELDAALATA